MSGIAGIYNLDGRPVDPALLMRMTDVISHRGPDGAGHWINGPVGLGHRMLHTTPESLHEQQPLTDETGNLCLTLDGRVDNREELIAALKAKGARLREDTDAEIILRAYEQWGEKCAEMIIGDFAFAIWDGRNQQLFCARDFLGLKPFYYYTDGRIFLCGSALRQLFEDESISREPNEGMIGEYLAVEMPNIEETLYQKIFRLPPGHFLLIQSGLVRKERYFDINPARVIRYRTDKEYAEHFFEILKESVRCRLRSHKPVGAYLSGGLDSSSIVGMSQLLCRGQRPIDVGFETFSMLFPGFPNSDESDYIREVVRMWGMECNMVYPDHAEDYCYTRQVSRYRDFPDYPNGAMLESLINLAREKGFRVLLSGDGGDEWLTGGLSYCADLLGEFRILDWIREIRYESRHLDRGVSTFFYILKRSLWPLVPLGVRRAAKRLLKPYKIPAWIDQQFARKINLIERLRWQPAEPKFTSFAQRELHKMLTSGSLIHGREMQERLVSGFGLEERYPFYDRRLVEYAFALPEKQRRREGQTKFILREAMRGLIPEMVRLRHSKADFSHVFPKAFQKQGGECLFDSLKIASLGWVDKSQVLVMYRSMLQLYESSDLRYTTYMWSLWMVLGLELWAKAVFFDKEMFPQDKLAINEKGALIV